VLQLRDCIRFQQSFNRSNLRYFVYKKGNKVIEQMGETIQREYAGMCGIVYCSSRNDCEKVAEGLQQRFGIDARFYHAGLPADEKQRRQEAWSQDEFKVIVATVAFGMGINKPDVRFIMHHSLPKSVEVIAHRF
jgi:bloom syndrome protein